MSRGKDNEAMTKRQQKYEIREAVRGSFAGAQGRVSYDLEAGSVSEKDVDPEVLALLVAGGHAVDPSEPAQADEPVQALEAAESEESA